MPDKGRLAPAGVRLVMVGLGGLELGGLESGRRKHGALASGLAALLAPARIEVWVSSRGRGVLRDDSSGATYTGALPEAPQPQGSWRVERLEDLSGKERHFRPHDPATAPRYIKSVPVLGGAPGIVTAANNTSGFIMRFDWRVNRPFGIFVVIEGSGVNDVISESINRVNDPVPDLANVVDFATSTDPANPVIVAFQGGNGTPGTTAPVQGRLYLIAAIWGRGETTVRVGGVEEGREGGVSTGFIADSLSLLNNPTVQHGQNRWLGHFGEYLLVSGDLGPVEIATIERDLAGRWGITLPGGA